MKIPVRNRITTNTNINNTTAMRIKVNTRDSDCCLSQSLYLPFRPVPNSVADVPVVLLVKFSLLISLAESDEVLLVDGFPSLSSELSAEALNVKGFGMLQLGTLDFRWKGDFLYVGRRTVLFGTTPSFGAVLDWKLNS